MKINILIIERAASAGYLTMSFSFINKLPTPEEIREQYPISPELAQAKAARDAEIKDVITGKSNKFLVIIGPCSADNEDSVCDYVNRLAKVNDKVKDKLILIPRIYTNKPRTTGDGYKGIASQPDPTRLPDMEQGLISTRRLHLRAIDLSSAMKARQKAFLFQFLQCMV